MNEPSAELERTDNRTSELHDQYEAILNLGKTLLHFADKDNPVQNMLKLRLDPMTQVRFQNALENKDREMRESDLNKTTRASLELLFETTSAMNKKGVERKVEELLTHGSADDARALLQLKNTIDTGFRFFKAQLDRHPSLVDTALKEFYLRQGPMFQHQDSITRRLYAQTGIELATHAIPHPDFNDVLNPFYKFRKELKNEVPTLRHKPVDTTSLSHNKPPPLFSRISNLINRSKPPSRKPVPAYAKA